MKCGHFAIAVIPMRRARRFAAIAGMGLLLSACGQYLGSYTVDGAHVATELPKSTFGPAQPGRYLEIDLASQTSLTAISSKVDGVYVDADFCPLRNPYALVAFGPYGDDGRDLGLPSNAAPLSPDRDGHFRYRVYIAIAFKPERATEPGQTPLPSYDLRGINRDICVRLFAPGYNLIKSVSNTIKVPGSVISRALKQGTVSGFH